MDGEGKGVKYRGEERRLMIGQTRKSTSLYILLLLKQMKRRFTTY